MKDLESPFWRFSVTFYGTGQVESTCLQLQDGWNLDVNVLLYCLWQGGQTHRLERSTLLAACRSCADWRGNVVQPLREARRWMKGKSAGIPALGEPLRDRIKALELAAEKTQQDWLAALPVAYDEAQPLTAAACNLAAYLDIEGVATHPKLLAGLGALLAEAHPDASESALTEARAILGNEQGRR